jgi:hypothetical protein
MAVASCEVLTCLVPSLNTKIKTEIIYQGEVHSVVLLAESIGDNNGAKWDWERGKGRERCLAVRLFSRRL